LPVSPYMFPVRNNLEVHDASLTPLGSPATFQLDAFEGNALGYVLHHRRSNGIGLIIH
jgi:hypothetical protein